MRGRHSQDAAANDVEGLAELGVLELGLTVLGEGTRDRIARFAPLAKDETLGEQDDLF
jgi:hypothetical protein